MKKLILPPVILAIMLSFGCMEPIKYPNYLLRKTKYIPNSLKVEHRKYITDIMSLAHSNHSDGDCEYPEAGMYTARDIADELFEVTEYGLWKCYDENYYNCEEILPHQMNNYELKILNNLLTGSALNKD